MAARCLASRPVKDSLLCDVSPRYVFLSSSDCISCNDRDPDADPFNMRWLCADDGLPPSSHTHTNVCFQLTRSIWKMLGPFAKCEPPLHCQSPGVASCTPAIAIDLRCPQWRQRQRRRWRQRVTDGTAMAPWNGPNHYTEKTQFLGFMIPQVVQRH